MQRTLLHELQEKHLKVARSLQKESGYMATAFGATDFITAGARQRAGDEPLIMDQESEEGLEGQRSCS